jgi:hypothetical protein
MMVKEARTNIRFIEMYLPNYAVFLYDPPHFLGDNLLKKGFLASAL